jgi:hypothetical protein
MGSLAAFVAKAFSNLPPSIGPFQMSVTYIIKRRKKDVACVYYTPLSTITSAGKRFNHSARSHPQSAMDLIHTWLDLSTLG